MSNIPPVLLFQLPAPHDVSELTKARPDIADTALCAWTFELPCGKCRNKMRHSSDLDLCSSYISIELTYPLQIYNFDLNLISVSYTVIQLLKYKFLSLLIILSLTTAVPAPFSPHTSFHTTTDTPPVCRPWRCADDTAESFILSKHGL